MAAIKLHLVLLAVVALTQFVTCKNIKILSDFTSPPDKEFFKTTFPWIAKNIGPKLRVKYYFKDAPDGGKRMCVTDNLKRNLLLQAEYLKCEANEETNCLKNMPIDQRKLDKCIRKSHKKIRAAEKQFRKYGTGETPLVIKGRSRQTVHDPMTVLLNICGMFGRKQPVGCRKPLEAPIPATPTTTEPCTQPHSTKPASDTTSPTSKLATESTTIPSTTSSKESTTIALNNTSIPSTTSSTKESTTTIASRDTTKILMKDTVVKIYNDIVADLSDKVRVSVSKNIKVKLLDQIEVKDDNDGPIRTVPTGTEVELQNDVLATLPHSMPKLWNWKLLQNTTAKQLDDTMSILLEDANAEPLTGTKSMLPNSVTITVLSKTIEVKLLSEIKQGEGVTSIPKDTVVTLPENSKVEVLKGTELTLSEQTTAVLPKYTVVKLS